LISGSCEIVGPCPRPSPGVASARPDSTGPRIGQSGTSVGRIGSVSIGSSSGGRGSSGSRARPCACCAGWPRCRVRRRERARGAASARRGAGAGRSTHLGSLWKTWRSTAGRAVVVSRSKSLARSSQAISPPVTPIRSRLVPRRPSQCLASRSTHLDAAVSGEAKTRKNSESSSAPWLV